ncbi:MAG TPA: PEP-CTERM sorting domain-containing protein [Phycisphaerae bacterium]|nr:PEP-CTERM sorting domain-containing protein [Phycisphaerae bacterium]
MNFEVNRGIIAGIVAATAVLAGSRMTRADVIAQWTFETSQPTSAGPVSPEVGAGTATATHSGTATYSDVTNNTAASGNGSSFCWGSTGWNVNDTNFWQFQVSTVGYNAIQLGYDQVSSNTGPNAFVLEYSTDGTNFTSFGSAYTANPNSTFNGTNYAWSSTAANANDHYSFDLSSIPGLSDASSVDFRVAVEATGQASNSTKAVSGSGLNFIDNVTVSGTPDGASAPEPASLGIMALGAASLLNRRQKH